jgi:hypothetical protein
MLHDFRRIKKLISYFSKVEKICYGFSSKEIFMNLVNRDKAHKTQVSKLGNHKLGFGFVSMVS